MKVIIVSKVSQKDNRRFEILKVLIDDQKIKLKTAV